MTSPWHGKKFDRQDALRLENANDEIIALKQFITKRSEQYEDLLELDINRGYSRRVDPFHVETRANNAGVEMEVFKVEVSYGDCWRARYVPVDFVFSDGSFEKKYEEAKSMVAHFYPVKK